MSRTPSRLAAARHPKAPVPPPKQYPSVMCRSCGKRPGLPMSMPGQMTRTELCAVCANLRKERIRMNRAAERAQRGGLH